MRIKNTLKNSFTAVGSYLVIAVLAIVLRKNFLTYLPTEYLGYEGLFTDIFAILSVADLGIGSIILYRMYPAIANNDEDSLQKLMSVYKFLYRIVGACIFIIGLILVPFLKIIIKDEIKNWTYVYIVYFIQLSIQLCAYFLAYKRVMFVATMREAEAIKIETGCTMISNIIKIIVILTTKNYILYLLVGVLYNFGANVIIAKKVNREFSYVKKDIKITKEDIKALGIWNDVKNSIFQKICGAIYGGTDSILISTLLGINFVAFLNNYNLIAGYVNNVLNKILNPFQQSIGNYIHSDSQGRKNEMFHMFDRISFFIACFVSVSFFNLLNPFIALVFGEKYLLGTMYVMMYSINQYVAYNHKFLAYYRASFGKYELDKYFIAAAAILNIVFSIILAHYMGIAGIILGTVIGHMGFWIGRVRVVYTEYIDESVVKYILIQLGNLVLWIAEMAGTYYICNMCPSGFLGFILRGIVCLTVPNILNLLLFLKTKSMGMIWEYVKKTKEVINAKNIR